MAVLCVGSVRAAPGATTLAVALAAAWPRPMTVVEADPDGGVLAVRHGLAREPGLAALAARTREEPSVEALAACCQVPSGGQVPVVVAPEAPDIVTRILGDVAGGLAAWLRRIPGTDILVDCGRLGPRAASLPTLLDADEALVVARPRADELYALASRMPSLCSRGGRPGVVLVGDQPYEPGEAARQLGFRLAGVVADDPRAARVVSGQGLGMGLRRSSFVRSVRSLSELVADQLAEPVVPIPAHDEAELAEPVERPIHTAPARSLAAAVLRAGGVTTEGDIPSSTARGGAHEGGGTAGVGVDRGPGTPA